jgi:inner membrane protein involved in colicin E2 resistance
MELVTEPDLYSPSIDDMGNYVDKIPPFSIIKKGIRCPCGSRKDKTYDTHSIFSAHIKTKHHQKWLQELNTNRANHYIENEKLKNALQNQRMIIANLEKELQKRSMTIDYLTQHLTTANTYKVNHQQNVNNLLDFD